jgi:hypothetical protein
VACSFDNQVPKIATFFQAKGLTFDCVALPRLTAKAYGFYDSDRIKRMMFVGIARATQWAYLSTVQGEEFPEVTTLNEAAEQGHLVIQTGGSWEGAGGAGGGRHGPGADHGESEDFPVL